MLPDPPPRLESARGETASERRVLRELLETPGFLRMRLPAALEAGYARHHHELALRNLRTYWPLVAVGLVVLAVLTSVAGLDGRERGFVAVGGTWLAAAIALVVLSLYVAQLRERIERVVAFVAFVALLGSHLGTTVTADLPELRAMAEYTVVFVTVAVGTVANLRFGSAITTCAAATLALLGLSAITGLAPDWGRFPFYTVGALVVAAIVGSTSEIRERTVFLQERLLALEKRELDLLTRELAAISREDALTGLPNRRHFDEVLAREWAIGHREGTGIGLFFIDVDHFKRFNDLYGHPAGDACLAEVGRALRGALRGTDFLARYGGEEFVGILPRTEDPAQLEALARRLVEAVDALAVPHEASEAAPFVTVSLGVACAVPSEGSAPEALVRAADAALYQAKSAGRHRYVMAG